MAEPACAHSGVLFVVETLEFMRRGGRIEGKGSIRLAVTIANSETEAAALLETARARLGPVETFSCPLSPVIGTHVGPGTLALNYVSGIP